MEQVTTQSPCHGAAKAQYNICHEWKWVTCSCQLFGHPGEMLCMLVSTSLGRTPHWKLKSADGLGCSSPSGITRVLSTSGQKLQQIYPGLPDCRRQQLYSNPGSADNEGLPVKLSITITFFILPFKYAKQEQDFFPSICMDRRCNLSSKDQPQSLFSLKPTKRNNNG